MAQDQAKHDARIKKMYANMVLRNTQKRDSLRKLARVSCEMSENGWSKRCDDLFAFYRTRDSSISDIEMNFEAMINDHRWAIKSDAQMAQIKAASDARVAKQNRSSAFRVTYIRKYYKGNRLRWAIRREAKRVQRKNMGFNRQYYRVFSQNTRL